MVSRDCFILMGIGWLFIIIGLAAIIWGQREEKSYYNALATRRGDTREFMEHWPPRPQPGALKTGGWIAIAIGVVMFVTGGTFYLFG